MKQLIDMRARAAFSKLTGLRYVSLALLILSGCVATQNLRAQDSAGEYQIKAAFIFHFAQLVNWPDGALTIGTQTLNLCLFADEPHFQEIQETVEGKRVGTRTFQVRAIRQPQDIQGCNILFMSRDENKHQAVVLDSLREMPVLTVGETDNFLSEGGIIRFHLQDNRIRFDINLAAANRAGLQISSRLLLLATHVIRVSAENHEGS